MLLVNCEVTTDQIEIILIKASNSGVHQLELPALRQHGIIDSLLLGKNTLGPKDGMFKEETAPHFCLKYMISYSLGLFRRNIK